MKRKITSFSEFEMRLICCAVEYCHNTWQEWSELDMSSIGFDEEIVEQMADGYEALFGRLKDSHPSFFGFNSDPAAPEEPEEEEEQPDNVIKFPVPDNNREE